MLNGIRLALTYIMIEVEASTDSTCVVYYYFIKKPPLDVRKVLPKLKEEMTKIQFFSLGHNYHKTNRLVDKLASTIVMDKYVKAPIPEK